jgi:hypothetical protein
MHTTGLEADLHEAALDAYPVIWESTVPPSLCKLEFAESDPPPDPEPELQAASTSGRTNSANPMMRQWAEEGRLTADDRMRWASLESCRCRGDISSARSGAR